MSRVEELEQRVRKLEQEREQILLVVFGGEDAPGYAAAQGLEQVRNCIKDRDDSYAYMVDERDELERKSKSLRARLSSALWAMRKDMQENCPRRHVCTCAIHSFVEIDRALRGAGGKHE